MRRSISLAVLLAALVVVWIASGELARPEPETRTPTEGASATDDRQRVRFAEVTAEQATQRLSFTGVTQPNRRTVVRTETGGAAVRLPVSKGDRVVEGDVLAELDMRARQERLAEAEAAVEHARQSYEASQRLRDEGFRAELNFLESARQLAQARARQAEIREEIEDTTVKAPFAGVVDERLLELGATTSAGTQVARLVDLDPLEVEMHVPEADIAQVTMGAEVAVTFGDGTTRRGEVTYIAAESDAQTRSYTVTAEVANPDAARRAGRTVSAEIIVGQQMVHRLPRSALVLNAAGDLGVYTLTEADEIAFQPITVVSDSRSGMQVTGLPDTVRLVTVGHGFVEPQERVRAVEDSDFAQPGGQRDGAV